MDAKPTNEKLCHKCLRVLPLDAFPLTSKKRYIGSRYSPCKDCRSFQKENYRMKNRDHVRKLDTANARRRRRERQGEPPPPLDPAVKHARKLAKQRAYYAAHREEIIAGKRRKLLANAHDKLIGGKR